MTTEQGLFTSHIHERAFVLTFFLAFTLILSFLTITSPSVNAEPTVDYIRIEDVHGNVVENRTYRVGDMDFFIAVGYNYTNGSLGPVVVTWESYNPNVGEVNRSGSSTTFHALNPGSTWVHAFYNDGGSNGTNGAWNVTGLFTVQHTDIEYVQIRDASKGAGEIVTERIYYVSDEDTYYAAAYNFTKYLADVEANWTSNDTSVCTITRHGFYATFKAINAGVCQVRAEYNSSLWNITGDLIVKHRTVLTVDDSGGADYLTIREAVENASSGYVIYVYNGTYNESVFVNKSLIFIGESMSNVIVDGKGGDIVFHVVANNVNITKFTIRNAFYAVYLDHVNLTRITYSTITDYVYGIFSNRTRDAFIAWNTITQGEYGIVTDHANNDAVRYNTISYNSKYGAKDYDSSLRNCFNWNHFHHNKVAYYYDPDEPLEPLEFDGNLIEDNEIGIKAAYASSLIVTNNTILRNQVGIDLLQSSPNIAFNLLRDNEVGIRFEVSSAQIYGNSIFYGDYGIVGTGSSPSFEYNTIMGQSELAVSIVNGDEVRLRGNDADGGIVRLVDSFIRDLSLKRSRVEQVNCTVIEWGVDHWSVIEVKWYLTINVLGQHHHGVNDAQVTVRNAAGDIVADLVTGDHGVAGPIELTGLVKTITGTVSVPAYEVEVSLGDMFAVESISMMQNEVLYMSLGPIPTGDSGLQWLFFGIVGSAAILTVAGLLSIEVFLYLLVSLFIPLYTKLRKENILDHYNRGRVYQFIELNPGEHFNAIKRALDLNIGTATYHLEVLSREGLIRSRQDGIYKRFYPSNMPIPPSNGGNLSEVQMRVFNLIRESPGVTQKELARLLDVRQSTLNYQISRLQERGFVAEERKGRKVHYYAKELPPPE